MEREEFFAGICSAGVDVPDALARFMGNQQLYLSFLRRFPQAMDLPGLTQALETRQEELFYRKVHDLKSMAGNLSIVPVAELAKGLQEEYRENGFSRVHYMETMLDKATKAAAPLVKLIREYDAQGGMG